MHTSYMIHSQIAFAGTALACAGIASVYDLSQRRIPNFLTLSGFVAGLVVHAVTGGFSGASMALAAAFIAGLAFLPFYLVRGMGAGDVKLIAAVASLNGFTGLASFLVGTALAGTLNAIIVSLQTGRLRQTLANAYELLAHHRGACLTPHAALNLSAEGVFTLPYALPIAAGCFFAVCKAVFGGLL